jgi:hypothetical protein
VDLNSFEVLNAFAAQLERHIADERFHTKVIVTPSSIKEDGLVIKVSVLKTFLPDRTPASRKERTLRIRVSVAGTAESHTGLKQALAAIEALDDYLVSPGLRLEVEKDETIRSVPNSRITQAISEEDSFIDSPDSIKVQDVQDDRIVFITIPEGVTI